MSLAKTLEKIEDKYYNELDEERDAVIEELSEMHKKALAKGLDEFRKFSAAAREICGGVYIPYLLWVELSNFIDNPEDRSEIYSLVGAFVNSGFEDIEKKKMKSLLITYIAIEKEFEVNKLMTLVVEKAHPDVVEYFRKVQNFVEKNKTSVDMYTEKFQILKDREPDFDLLRMPVVKIREKFGVTE